MIPLNIVFSLLFISCGILYYIYDTDHEKNEKANEIEAIAKLKLRSIEHWRQERLKDATNLSQSPFFSEAAKSYARDKKNKKIFDLSRNRLLVFKTTYDYDDVYISDENGNILIGTTDSVQKIDPVFKKVLNKSKYSKTPVISDFEFCETHKSIHMLISSVMYDEENGTHIFLLIKIDPNDFLYPLLENWPIESSTSETLIIEKAGDKIRFLNEPRHQKNLIFTTKEINEHKDLPAVKAAMGERGLIEGKDYMNNDVIAYITEVKDTPWLLISKIDKSELLKDVFGRQVFIGAIVLLSIIVMSSLLLILYYSKQSVFYKFLYTKEKELWQSQKDFRTTLYSIGDAVISTDKSGKIVFINPVAEKLTGWLEEEAKGKHISEVFTIINEVTRDTVENPIEKVLKEGIVVGLANHTILVSKNGEEYPIADAGAPIHSEDGLINGVVLVFRDQTVERVAEKKLRESEQKFKDVFEKSNAGKSLTLPTGEINVNECFCNMLGYTQQELKNKKWQEITPPEDIPKVTELIDSLISGTKGSIRFEKKYLHKDGSIVIGDVSTTLRCDSTGAPLYFITTVLDITRQKEFEKQLIIAKEEAEEMGRVKASFLANMSHEIRTPMVAILGYTEMLNEITDDNDIKNYTEIINNGAKRLFETLNLILEISMLEANKLELELSPTNIVNETQLCFETYKNQAEKKNISYKFDAPDNPLFLNVDRRLISEILNNLINNALKYTKKGSIVVSITEEYFGDIKYAAIRVKDTGIGISEKDKTIIWDEFRQGSEGWGRSFEGTGLGLSITKKFTEKLGGRIYIEESKVNEGTTFCLLLPLINSNITEIENSNTNNTDMEKIANNLKPNSENITTLLYVEDDEIAVDLVSTMLKSKYNLDIAVNGNKAVEKVKSGNYDGILMDINLGKGIDGVQTTKEIRGVSGYETKPIIAITAYALIKDKDEFLKNGCSHYIAKPFKAIELKNLLNEIFKK